MGRRTLELRLDVEPGERADHAVARAFDGAGRPCGRRDARRLVEAGAVTLDGRRLRRSSEPIPAGRRTFVVQADETLLPAPQASTTRFAFTDADILALAPDHAVVIKPPGLPTDPTRDPRRDNVIDAFGRYLAARGDDAGGARAVHRLDRDTSGVLLIARTREAAARLGEAFRRRSAEKTYLAICIHGPDAPPWALGEERTIDAPLGELPGPGRTRYGVVPTGKPARTRLVREAGNDRASLFRAHPETGRTHQVRIHLAHAGFPIAGDRTYGAVESEAPRVMLHAAELRLDGHAWSAPPPPDFAELAARLALPPAAPDPARR